MVTTFCYSTNANSRGKSSSTFITYVQNNGIYLYYRKNYSSICNCFVINPSLHFNKIFKTQAEKFLDCSFYDNENY